MDNFTRKVKENTAHIDSLTVVGHTDRLGPDEYNYTLSLKRAGTVKELLEGNEVTVHSPLIETR
ncbi:OmpA family protein [Morganella morganii]|uniref:OmpA family protein n=1 Tax=Morganella morganii TaxID=582 RepID=UPI003877C8E1